jgi:hypothetical protein
MTLNNVINLKIENGICSYDEKIVDNSDVINRLKRSLVGKTKIEQKEILKEIEIEKGKYRLIHYEFEISKVKMNCVDCGKILVQSDDFLQFVYNNIIRGNYCATCNAKYG